MTTMASRISPRRSRSRTRCPRSSSTSRTPSTSRRRKRPMPAGPAGPAGPYKGLAEGLERRRGRHPPPDDGPPQGVEIHVIAGPRLGRSRAADCPPRPSATGRSTSGAPRGVPPSTDALAPDESWLISDLAPPPTSGLAPRRADRPSRTRRSLANARSSSGWWWRCSRADTSSSKGVPGPGQDPVRPGPRPRPRPPFQPNSIHARPAPGRPDRHPGLSPGDRHVRRPDWADRRLGGPGRRDQPGPGQGPERPAGGDAGGAGHRRRPDHPPARSVLGPRHPESRSSTRGPTRSPRPSSTAS